MISWDTLVPGRHSGDELRYNCNHCGDVRGRLYINRKNAKYHCFKCGIGGIAPKNVMVMLLGASWMRESSPKRTTELRASGEISWAAKRYLQARNINHNLAHVFGVRSLLGANSGRLGFPARYRVQDEINGRHYYVDMTTGAHATRKGIQPKSLLHNELEGTALPMILGLTSLLKPSTPYLNRKTGRFKCNQKHAILVEGPSDAFRILTCLHDLNCPDLAVVCLWGKNMNEDQAFRLGKVFPNMEVFFDRDAEADAFEAKRKLEIFGEEVTVHTWEETAYKDMNDPAEVPDYVMREHIERLFR